MHSQVPSLYIPKKSTKKLSGILCSSLYTSKAQSPSPPLNDVPSALILSPSRAQGTQRSPKKVAFLLDPSLSSPPKPSAVNEEE